MRSWVHALQRSVPKKQESSLMSFVSNILGGAKDEFKGGIANAVNEVGRRGLNADLSNIAEIPGNLISNVGLRGGAAFGDGFNGLQNIRDVVQDWCWYCVLPEIGGMQLPWYYVSGANAPFRNFQVETLKRNGHSVHYVESYEVSGPLTLKFVVDGSSKSNVYVKRWQGQILWDYDPSQSFNQGVWGMPSGYKKTITLVVMSVARKELLTFKYFGCFPTNPQAFELGAGSSNPLELSVEFQVEDVDITIRNDLGFLENLKESAKGLAIWALTGGAAGIIDKFKSVPTGLTNTLNRFTGG
jgi:hypothetical protein